jgi:murein DD-endopeptidase MepM/ murein hydrolase activator NlpD
MRRLPLLTALALLVWPPAAPAGARRDQQVQRFAWPLPLPHPVLRPFAAPETPYGPGHRGVDLGASPTAEVTAANTGIVIFAGPVAGRQVVSIAHSGGLRTTYEPLTPAVRPGQPVRRGDLIGHLTPGHPGCDPACLHWGAKRGEEYLDPLRLLSRGHVRLLPCCPDPPAP